MILFISYLCKKIFLVSRSRPFQKGLSHAHTHKNRFRDTFQIWCIFYNTIARPPTHLSLDLVPNDAATSGYGGVFLQINLLRLLAQ
jgi:hypothetical protein